MSQARYDFASDNVAGAMPEAIEALVAANCGHLIQPEERGAA